MKAGVIAEVKSVRRTRSSKGSPKGPGGSTAKTSSAQNASQAVAALLQTDDPVKQAIITRVARMIANTLRNATPANLQQAVEAPTDTGSAAYLLSMAASLDTAVRELDPTASALLRGFEMKQDLLKRAGGTLDTARVATLLGISRQAIAKRVRGRTLLAIQDASGHLQFPAFQFTGTGTVKDLDKVLAAFSVDSSWTRLAVLLDTDEAVGGKRIIDALCAGELQGVLDVVRSFGA